MSATADFHLQHRMDYGCPPRSAIRRIAAVFTSFLKWNCSPQLIGVTLRYSCIPSIPYPGWSCLRRDARAFGFAPWSSNRRVNGASGSWPRWFIQKCGCGCEEGCVTSEPIGVDCRMLIDVHAAVKQPTSDLDLVIVRAHMQQSPAGKGCSMCRQHFIVTPKFCAAWFSRF